MRETAVANDSILEEPDGKWCSLVYRCYQYSIIKTMRCRNGNHKKFVTLPSQFFPCYSFLIYIIVYNPSFNHLEGFALHSEESERFILIYIRIMKSYN